MSRRLAVVAVFMLVLLAAFAPPTLAQNGCVAFRAVTQAQVPTDLTLNTPANVWGGGAYASLGAPGAQKASNNEALFGAFSGQDSATYTPGVDLRERTFGGMATGGSYTFAFGDANADPSTYVDRFTVTLGRAVWNVGPGQSIGDYMASGTITSGSGRFASASGNLTIHGPFWFSNALGIGRWTPEVDGTICGMK